VDNEQHRLVRATKITEQAYDQIADEYASTKGNRFPILPYVEKFAKPVTRFWFRYQPAEIKSVVEHLGFEIIKLDVKKLYGDEKTWILIFARSLG